MKHTQGEWITGNEKNKLAPHFILINGFIIHAFKEAIENYVMSREEAEANAKLIAAAPMMLKALKMIRDFDEDSEYDDPGAIAIEAIKKATA